MPRFSMLKTSPTMRTVICVPWSVSTTVSPTWVWVAVRNGVATTISPAWVNQRPETIR